MTRNELVQSLISAGYFRGDWSACDDVEYSTISDQFVRVARGAWVESLPPELVQHDQYGIRQPRWIQEVFDCDNIALDFLCFIARCMAVDAINTGKKRGNVAAGQLNFCPTPETAHAIVWFMDHNGTAHHFDPASGKLDHLSNDQVASIFSGDFA